MTSADRQAVRVARDLERRLARAERRITYLERDKKSALTRARKAETEVLKLRGRLFLMGVGG